MCTYRNSCGRSHFHKIKLVNSKTHQVGTHWNRLCEGSLLSIVRQIFGALDRVRKKLHFSNSSQLKFGFCQ